MNQEKLLNMPMSTFDSVSHSKENTINEADLQFPRHLSSRQLIKNVEKKAYQILQSYNTAKHCLQQERDDKISTLEYKKEKLEKLYRGAIEEKDREISFVEKNVDRLLNWKIDEIKRVNQITAKPDRFLELGPESINRIPAKILKFLYPYQIESVNRMFLVDMYLRDYDTYFYLGNQAGSGKSRVALTYAKLQNELTIIVVPSNMFDHWLKECKLIDLIPGLDIACYRDARAFDKNFDQVTMPKMHLIGLNCLLKHSKTFFSGISSKFANVPIQYILDEISTAKSMEHANLLLAKQKKWILSATYIDHNSYGYKKRDIGSDSVVEAHVDFIKASYDLPDPLKIEVFCKGIQSSLRKFLPKKVLELINQGDMEAAIRTAGGSTSHSNVVHAHTHKLTKEIEAVEKEIGFIDSSVLFLQKIQNKQSEKEEKAEKEGKEGENEILDNVQEKEDDTTITTTTTAQGEEADGLEERKRKATEQLCAKLNKINKKANDLKASQNGGSIGENELVVGVLGEIDSKNVNVTSTLFESEKETLVKQLQLLKDQRRLIEERINEATCPICFTDSEDVLSTVTKCCAVKLCFECLIESLKANHRCPWCRAEMESHQKFDIIQSYDASSVQSTEQIMDTKNRVKDDVLLEMIGKEPSKAWVIVSDNDKSFAILKLLQEQNIKAEVLRGTSGHVRNLIRRHKEGEFPILFLNRKIAGTGIHLAHANRMVFYHAFDSKYDYVQAIARCQRMGRDISIPLKIYYLLCNGEAVPT